MYYMKSIGINFGVRYGTWYTVYIVQPTVSILYSVYFVLNQSIYDCIDHLKPWQIHNIHNIFNVTSVQVCKSSSNQCMHWYHNRISIACLLLLLFYENHINVTSNHLRYCWSEIDEGCDKHWVRRSQARTYINICLILSANGIDKFSLSQMRRISEINGRHSFCIHPKKACRQFNVWFIYGCSVVLWNYFFFCKIKKYENLWKY